MFGYEVNSDDKSVYELISEYSKESEDNSSSNKEYSLGEYEESTLYRLNIIMNRIKNLNESSNLFNDDEKLISLDNKAFPSSNISSSISYEYTSTYVNEWVVPKLSPQDVFGKSSRWIF